MSDQKIATEAAVRIVDTLIYKWNISIEKIFDFLNTNIQYKELLNDDDTLICMMHDDSLDELIDNMGKQITGLLI